MKVLRRKRDDDVTTVSHVERVLHNGRQIAAT